MEEEIKQLLEDMRKQYDHIIEALDKLKELFIKINEYDRKQSNRRNS